MKKTLLSFFVLIFAATGFSQLQDYKKKPGLSVNFILNDFQTADVIRNSSLVTVFKDKRWSKINEMGPGLAINYFEGLSDHLDFMSSFGASIVSYTSKNHQTSGSDNFLLEVDANIMAKLLSDKYLVTPYVTAGTGISLYKVYWGGYIPLGLGVQFRLAENTYLNIQSQYRTGITDLANNHFNYSLGFGTSISNGTKKSQ